MSPETITDRFDFYWKSRPQKNMGWIVELWPGWQVRWSGWTPDPQPANGVWDGEWTATADASIGSPPILIKAQAIVGQHDHPDRMQLCKDAFAKLAAEVENRQSPTVGLGDDK